jgi:hypothetical protein
LPLVCTAVEAGHPLPVWSKNSCGLALIVFQQSSKPFTTLHGAFALCVLADRRKEQHIALTLMVPLVMNMRVVYLSLADKYHRLIRRLSKGQKVL